ncbi:hypothetical protein BRD17_04170 [Halobacteriales archaeon SW_7_68_16]|nr:MAG: hypothetical protein BRD17_04170 [Halobacteriales archaeon SW_7_68_16]
MSDDPAPDDRVPVDSSSTEGGETTDASDGETGTDADRAGDGIGTPDTDRDGDEDDGWRFSLSEIEAGTAGSVDRIEAGTIRREHAAFVVLGIVATLLVMFQLVVTLTGGA